MYRCSLIEHDGEIFHELELSENILKQAKPILKTRETLFPN